MFDEVRSLLVLQDRDHRVSSLTADLAKIPRDEERAKTRLAGDEEALRKAHEAIIQCDLRMKKVDLDAKTREESVKRLKIQQFETRKNEEFTAFSHEIARYEKEIDELETRELELMEEMDGLRAAQTEAEARLAKTRGFVEEDLAAILERKARVDADLAEARDLRATAAAAVNPDVLPLYERLMKTKNGIAVAPLIEGKCEGCHMKVIAATNVKVQAAKELAQCENCGRILYAE